MPHKIQKFRAILDFSFKLLMNGFEILRLNEATRYTAEQEAIYRLVKLLQRTVAAIAELSEDYGPIFFIKIDMKNVFWRMLFQVGEECSFLYVLPGE